MASNRRSIVLDTLNRWFRPGRLRCLVSNLMLCKRNRFSFCRVGLPACPRAERACMGSSNPARPRPASRLLARNPRLHLPERPLPGAPLSPGTPREKKKSGRPWGASPSGRHIECAGEMTTQPSGRSFEEVRILWHGRLNEARLAYERAVAQTEAALKEGVAAAPDAALARRLALFRESAAREEYVRILKIYADLVVRGISPEE